MEIIKVKALPQSFKARAGISQGYNSTILLVFERHSSTKKLPEK
jgi:hypothetical protein